MEADRKQLAGEGRISSPGPTRLPLQFPPTLAVCLPCPPRQTWSFEPAKTLFFLLSRSVGIVSVRATHKSRRALQSARYSCCLQGCKAGKWENRRRRGVKRAKIL